MVGTLARTRCVRSEALPPQTRGALSPPLLEAFDRVKEIMILDEVRNPVLQRNVAASGFPPASKPLNDPGC